MDMERACHLISASSGPGGLWRQHRAQDLSTPQAFALDRDVVLHLACHGQSSLGTCFRVGPAYAPAASGRTLLQSSPDGTRLVYVSQYRLFTRPLDQPKTTELAGTEGAYAPFFSPAGRWVAFFAGNKLKKVSVEGGAAIALCDAPNAQGGSWGEDGNIIAALGDTVGLFRGFPPPAACPHR